MAVFSFHNKDMEVDLCHFFSSAVDTLQILVIALGAELAVWGVINLLEGYGSDNPCREIARDKTAHGRWQRYPSGHDACTPAIRLILR
jgi:hypothetical protein